MITKEEVLNLENWKKDQYGFIVKHDEIVLRIYHNLPKGTLIRLYSNEQQLFVGKVADIKEFIHLCEMIGI